MQGERDLYGYLRERTLFYREVEKERKWVTMM